jgi:hypothetical protein
MYMILVDVTLMETRIIGLVAKDMEGNDEYPQSALKGIVDAGHLLYFFDQLADI